MPLGRTGRLLDSRVESLGSTPELIRPFVVSELRELVFGHMQCLPDAVLALQELCSHAGASGWHAGDQLDKPSDECDGCEVEQ